MNLITKFHFMKGIIMFFGFVFMNLDGYAQPFIRRGYALHEYDLLGKGARSAGMGYAFNAVSDDATAMSWNPAGMVQIKKPEVAFVNSLLIVGSLSRPFPTPPSRIPSSPHMGPVSFLSCLLS